MRKIIVVIIAAIIVITVFANIDWHHSDSAQSGRQPVYDNKILTETESKLETESVQQTESKIVSTRLWLDTVMYANGHAFGYDGDITDWGGWYFDTICVGLDRMLTYDSIAPSTLQLNLITRKITVNLGSRYAARQIKKFLGPISGFKRFHKKYELCVDSVYDEDYGMLRTWGEITFSADYADTCQQNADKINQCMVNLVYHLGDTKMEAPALSVLYSGYKQVRKPGMKYDGVVVDMNRLSDFIRDNTLKGWNEEDLAYESSAASDIDISAHIANDRYVTFSVYDYGRIGVGHGGYIETFHTFDMNSGKRLANNDIFKPNTLDKVKMQLFDVMARDPRYSASNNIKSGDDVQSRIEGWQSPNPLLEGTEFEEPEREFILPQGALTNSGVVFSFQPYEIDCWAAGAYHFIVPYKNLLPYMTTKAKWLICK